MKIVTNVRGGHQLGRTVVLRAILAMGSLVSTLLASGAGTHWY
jgi:hypothetical protein